MPRLLDPNTIPQELWEPDDDCIGLPRELADSWMQALSKHSLVEDAKRREMASPPVGGLKAKESAQHFAQAFDGSVARAELAVLDPYGDLRNTSDILLSALAGGRVCLVDAPGGAGAASLAFLHTVYCLRKHDILPRIPLDVELILGELSTHARGYAEEMLGGAAATLSKQSIHLTFELVEWNVLDQLSNRDLIRKMIVAGDKSCDTLLVVANFNHFLQRSGKFKKAEPNLAELFRHASGNARTHAIWIEPPMNSVLKDGQLFSRVWQMLEGTCRAFAKLFYPRESQLLSRCRFIDPLDSTMRHRCEIAVLPIQLGDSA